MRVFSLPYLIEVQALLHYTDIFRAYLIEHLGQVVLEPVLQRLEAAVHYLVCLQLQDWRWVNFLNVKKSKN